ncbi:MAG: DUF6265 family protein [Woeseiaceae bacterium]
MPEYRRHLILVLLVAQPVIASVNDLDWMSGCWAADNRETGSIEYWTPPAGGTMLGVSRTVADGKTIAFEYLRIETDDDDAIVLVASPSGQQTARFELMDMSLREVVFVNPNHDFPQRIIYRLIGDNKLHGRIEGTRNGQATSVDFPMSRISCDVDHPGR